MLSSGSKKTLLVVSTLNVVFLAVVLWQGTIFFAHLAPPTKAKAEVSAEGAHGEARAPAAAHGEDHGETKEKAPAESETSYSLDDIVSNVHAADPNLIHTLELKLELELFNSEGKPFMEGHKAALKNAVLESIYQQKFEQLGSLGGKLYFKEQLITRLNESLKTAQIRDIHFNIFLLQ